MQPTNQHWQELTITSAVIKYIYLPYIIIHEEAITDSTAVCIAISRQCDRDGKGVVFTTTIIVWSGFNLHPGNVVAFLDKTFYDDYLCLELRTSSKFSGQELKKIYRDIGSLETSKLVQISPHMKHSYRNEKCADHSMVSVWRCSETGG